VRPHNFPKHQRLPDLGEREVLVLEALWNCDEATAQAIHGAMPDAGISLSTVQTTLERLHRKRLVSRSRQGRAYRYRAVMDRAELIGGLLGNIAQQLAAGELAPMISGFLNYVGTQAPELGDELSRSLRGERHRGAGDGEGDDD
jgi:predicted transcriptional regulator